MSRPRKCRRICEYPQTVAFSPEDSQGDGKAVILTVDEYETIRLIDKEGLSQEQCGDVMQIARTTVQQIYTGARKKLADVLVEGRPLRIEGGEYQLCNGGSYACGQRECYKQKINRRYAKTKGEATVRIAVTYENGTVFQHFGRTEQFKIYDAENGKILSSEVVDIDGGGHGALAGILNALHVDALICGGIGAGARTALAEAGIKLFGGVSGSADRAAEALAAGNLEFDSDARCDHCGNRHGEEHT